jgi:hypothetical protein
MTTTRGGNTRDSCMDSKRIEGCMGSDAHRRACDVASSMFFIVAGKEM